MALNTKLSDFGLARRIVQRQSRSHEVGTLWYRAPELLLGSKFYAGEIDIWATGCVFAELIQGYTLFPGRDERDQLELTFSLRGTTMEAWPNSRSMPVAIKEFEDYHEMDFGSALNRVGLSGLDLLSKFLTLKPSLRITAAEALIYPYFRSPV